MDNKLTPFEATHAGILVKDEIEARNITQKELAVMIGVKQSFLNEIIKGKRPITAETALYIGKALDIPADYLMRFQSQYELDCARIKEKNIQKEKNISLWKIITEYVPVNSLSKLGYLGNDLQENIDTIMKIFRVNTIDGIIGVYSERRNAFYKKSEKLENDKKNMITWSVLAEYEAGKKQVDIFNFDNVPRLIKELNEIFFENKNVLPRLDDILTLYGIKFNIVKKLDKTPIDGYSFWSEQNPAIAITLRHSRLDNLAFTLLHELGHIVLHLKENKDLKFMDLDKIQEGKIEDEANDFAETSLIPNKSLNEIDYLNPIDEDILNISLKNKINPAIILGRICHLTSNYKVRTNISRAIN